MLQLTFYIYIIGIYYAKYYGGGYSVGKIKNEVLGNKNDKGRKLHKLHTFHLCEL